MQPVTLHLFRDLFTIFYEPLIRVYKSANVYNSVTDFAVFVDDMIKVVEKAQSQGRAILTSMPSTTTNVEDKSKAVDQERPADMSSDPNQTVQSFIDLCARHENNFYKFVHEVHIHDDGLFEKLMGWLEGILSFLRHGPKCGALDMNRLVQEAVQRGDIDADKAKGEIDNLIAWHAIRRKWHEDKTRQKMASGGDPNGWMNTVPKGAFTTSDFGLDEVCVPSPAFTPVILTDK
jgi:polyhydroxyalkanoate synthesis regulator phasin